MADLHQVRDNDSTFYFKTLLLMSTAKIDTAFGLLDKIKVSEKLLADLQSFDEQRMGLEVQVNAFSSGALSDYAKGLKQHMLDNLPARINQLKQEFNDLSVTTIAPESPSKEHEAVEQAVNEFVQMIHRAAGSNADTTMKMFQLVTGILKMSGVPL